MPALTIDLSLVSRSVGTTPFYAALRRPSTSYSRSVGWTVAPARSTSDLSAKIPNAWSIRSPGMFLH